jgi:hypothetical protein
MTRCVWLVVSRVVDTFGQQTIMTMSQKDKAGDSSLDGLDKLTLTCRILMDARFWELRNKLERVQTKLFWRTYSASRLGQCLTGMHWHLPSGCGGCCFSDTPETRGKPCMVADQFGIIVRRCGLTVQYSSDSARELSNCDMSGFSTCDDNTHFVILGKPHPNLIALGTALNPRLIYQNTPCLRRKIKMVFREMEELLEQVSYFHSDDEEDEQPDSP